MSEQKKYDITIIGGGLAGLAMSIQMVRKGYSVALFEKEQYPFHKVCGEYISLESWDFIEQLGLPLSKMQLPIIRKLIVSSPNGKYLEHDLPLGGFGISRYKIDNELKNIAVALGVILFENSKVDKVSFGENTFQLQTRAGTYESRACCGSFGKRSNLDMKWKRDFILQKTNKLNNYLGVKYHIKTNFAPDMIALHNFKNGYCGISKIEDDVFCLCYITKAVNLKNNNNSIPEMEKNVLHKNVHLKNIFETSEMLYKAPLTISKISFEKKNQVQDHILLLGDAAGMITPLCGNGMSMALHSSKIAALWLDRFLGNEISRAEMEKGYIKNWQHEFAGRLHTGRIMQQFFGKEWVTNIFISMMKNQTTLATKLIQKTHGEPF